MTSIRKINGHETALAPRSQDLSTMVQKARHGGTLLSQAKAEQREAMLGAKQELRSGCSLPLRGYCILSQPEKVVRRAAHHDLEEVEQQSTTAMSVLGPRVSHLCSRSLHRVPGTKTTRPQASTTPKDAEAIADSSRSASCENRAAKSSST